MKIIEVDGQIYARHWFRWYWVLERRFYPIQLQDGKRRKETS